MRVSVWSWTGFAVLLSLSGAGCGGSKPVADGPVAPSGELDAGFALGFEAGFQAGLGTGFGAGFGAGFDAGAAVVVPAPATGPGPVVLKTTPAFGPAAGGTVVTISGARFAAGATVTFGEISATSVTFVDSTVLEVVAPQGVPGLVTVSVSNPDRQVGTLTDAFRYVPANSVALTVTAVAPNAGPLQGGSNVVVVGTGFSAGTTVKVGGQPLGAQVIADPQSIRGVILPGPRGPADVVVTRLDGATATLAGGFVYSDLAAPGLTQVSPDRGPVSGGTVIVLTGTNFALGLVVKVGGVASTSVAVSDSHTAIARTPQHAAGLVDVRVENVDGVGTTLPSAFTYGTSFSVAALYPSRGPELGGNTIGVLGQGFQPGAVVKFGTTASISTIFNDSSQLVTVVPAGAVGPVDVSVVNPGGETSVLTGGYLYLPAPTLVALSPAYGPVTGGGTVQLTGTGFQPGAEVRFGAKVASNVAVASGTSLSCVVPAGTAGAVDVKLTNPDAQTVTRAAGYSYVAAPTLSSLSPPTGPIAGGTRVTLTGTGFASGGSVTFGGVAGLNTVADGGTLMETTTPATTTEGPVDVALTNADGQAATLVGAFTFLAPPIVGAVYPGRGPTTGGLDVAVMGRAFAKNALVRFGGVSATNVRFQSSASLVVTIPAHVQAPVDVEVENPDGQLGRLANAFTYGTPQPPPSVTAATPLAGPTSGGTQVVVSGSDFQLGAQVLFGTVAATSVSLVNPGTLNATTPSADAGVVTVTVRNPDLQTATLDGGFVYSNTPAPTLASLSPDGGAAFGGTVVTLSGTGFRTGAKVSFGARDGTGVVVVGPTQVRATTPQAAAAGTVDVKVTNDDNQAATLPLSFTYAAFPAPTLTQVVPATGPSSGATTVTLGGTGFRAGATVLFGTKAATSVTILSQTLATAVTPSGTPGLADVKITNVDGLSGTAVGAFTYQALPAPTVTAITPNAGPTSGGTNVTVTGTNFVPGATATVGGRAVTSMGVVSPTVIIFSTPTGLSGATDVIVTNPDNQSGILRGGFTYQGQKLFEVPSVDLLQTISYLTVQIAVADFNKDGRPDVAYANAGAATRIYLNAGGGVMTDRTSFEMAAIPATGIVAGDLNADGNPDLFVTVSGQRPLLLLGDGAGGFVDVASISFPPMNFSTGRSALADVDADGDLDVVVAVSGGLRLYLNDGAANFSDVTSSKMTVSSPGTTRDVAFVDVDKDGALDLVVTGTVSARVCMNNGFGAFTDQTATRLPVVSGSYAVAVGDVNGDAWSDILLARNGAEVLLLNDGTGRFTNQSAARFPAVADFSLGVAVADVDGDGDLDVAVENDAPAPRLYLNNGTGFFADTTSLSLPGGGVGNDVKLVDVDGDGDLDWIAAGATYYGINPGQSYVFVNTSIGRYVAPPTVAGISPNAGPAVGGTNFNLSGTNFMVGAQVSIGANRVANAQVVSATLIIGTTPAGLSGPADITVVNPNGLSAKKGAAFIYSGFPRYFDDEGFRLPSAVYGAGWSVPTARGRIAVGDLNGDSLPDFVVAGSGQARFWINDFSSTGQVLDVTPVTMPSRDFGRPVIGDVNGDGKKDVFLPVYNGQSMLFLNAGGGIFTDRSRDLPQTASSSRTAVFLDFDGDGDLDLLIGNDSNALQQMYLNFGVASGTFFDITAANLYFQNHAGSVKKYLTGDLNGDGREDLLGADNITFPYFKSSTGYYFAAAEFKMPYLTDNPSSIALGDVDGRNGLDIFVGRSYVQSRLLLNDGSGYFREATSTNLPDLTNAAVRGAGFLDVDGDGDQDLILAMESYPNSYATLLLNDGTGLMSKADPSLFSPFASYGDDLVVTDFEGDGDSDVVVSVNGSAPQLLRNRRLSPAPAPGPTITSITPVSGAAGAVLTLVGTGFTSSTTVTVGGVAAAGVMLNPDGTLVATAPAGLSGSKNVVITSGGQSYSAAGGFTYGSALFTDGAARLPAVSAIVRDAVARDLNGDGKQDVVLAVNGQSRLLLNQASNVMIDGTAARLPTASLDSYGVAIVDFNGDSALDVVLSNNAAPPSLYQNDGGTSFTNVTAARMPVGSLTARQVVATDLTGDGVADLAFATQAGPIVYTNNGGNFFDLTSVYIPGTGGAGYGIIAADFNLDGKTDLLHGSSATSLLLGTGPGKALLDVSVLKLPAPSGSYDWRYATGDVTGDGKADIVQVKNGASPSILAGDGRGYFYRAGRMPNLVGTDVALGDIDLDGDLDVVVCASSIARLWMNDGKGNFWDATAYNLPTQANSCNGVLLFDEDGDGDLDILVLPSAATPVRLFVNATR